MKRSGGHRIPGLNCCGQGRMCYRWSKRYCWGGRRRRCCVFLGHTCKNTHLVFFFPKSLRGTFLLFHKSRGFSGQKSPALPLHPPVRRMVGFFFCFGVHTRDVLLQRKTGVSYSPELAETAIIPWSVPSFPCCGSPQELHTFRLGRGW